jgi:hypothetical protein
LPNTQRSIKKTDVIFLVVCAALIGAFFIFHKAVSPVSGEEVIIEVENKAFGSYHLSENRVIKVNGILGTSTVVIKDGEVYMKESPCPNKVCIHMGKISDVNETIVCIPNRIYITVK